LSGERTPLRPVMEAPNDQEHLVNCLTSQGIAIRGNCLRLARNEVAFEIYNPNAVLHLSEVLSDFRVCIKEHSLYAGRAVIRSLIQTGLVLVCEVTLEDQWHELDGGLASARPAEVAEAFQQFLKGWRTLSTVLPEFKVIVGDLYSFLTDLRLWLEQAELILRSSPDGSRAEREHEVMESLRPHFISSFNALHERFEEISGRIEPAHRTAHQNYARRVLHSCFLCSPFGFRAFQKPLGYAGDYEMVNMITRDSYEGASLFAKAMNAWLLYQYPSVAHRNRLAYLRQCLEAESLRIHTRNGSARILSVGCGPAYELQRFIQESPLAERSEATLVDFNEETLDFAREAVELSKRQARRQCAITYQKKSVLQLIKESARIIADESVRKYDLIYCAGLFDYLTDRTCKQLTGVFFNNLAPGGVIVVTNVHDSKPFRHMLEFLLDWHLIYRDRTGLLALAPEQVQAEQCRIHQEATSTNLFLEVRRPEVRA